MGVKFSVIVPCCDVERYCRECLASVKGQTLGDFECIAVVEESGDGTDAAVEAAVGGDGRFRVVRQGRSGSPAAPRNTGLDLARGEWVVFLDGDDWLAGDALERLAEAAGRHGGADMLAAAVERTDGWVIDNWEGEGEIEMGGAEATVRLAGRTAFPRAMAFLYVYRREFLERHGLRFAAGLKHEDEEFTPRALYLARKVAVTHLAYYKYRLRGDSITAGARSCHARDAGRAAAALAKFYAGRAEATEAVRKAWARMTLGMIDHALFGGQSAGMGDGERLAALDEIYGGAGKEFGELVGRAGIVKRFNHMLVKAGWKARRLGWVRGWFRFYYAAAALAAGRRK